MDIRVYFSNGVVQMCNSHFCSSIEMASVVSPAPFRFVSEADGRLIPAVDLTSSLVMKATENIQKNGVANDVQDIDSRNVPHGGCSSERTPLRELAELASVLSGSSEQGSQQRDVKTEPSSQGDEKDAVPRNVQHATVLATANAAGATCLLSRLKIQSGVLYKLNGIYAFVN